MAMNSMSTAAALILSAAMVTGCQHTAAPAGSRAGNTMAEERLLDSFCAGGYCERVYTRFSDAELRRRFRNAKLRGEVFEPFIVRIEPDPSYEPNSP